MDDRSKHLVRRLHGQVAAKSRRIRHRTGLHTLRNVANAAHRTTGSELQEPDLAQFQRNRLFLRIRCRNHPDRRRRSHLHQPDSAKRHRTAPAVVQMEGI